jgi:hypothetical protein
MAIRSRQVRDSGIQMCDSAGERLKEAAPIMWSLLRRYEWSHSYEVDYCVYCDTERPEASDTLPDYGHAPTCEWLAVARHVGYRK